ncbi:MAG TPA: hypothetical protein EYQ42_04580 [Thiotrichaceae bacterium]|jgi:hypothetical protein|nr:hypothetical protein [Thiotrichaceae bacterium]HIM08722.1 hypothetical protein [Gammaproteobacteria bacterium]
MANTDQNDKELNEYLNGDSNISKAYRASNSSEPSSTLDDAILSAAKEAVENTAQKEKPAFHKSRWTLPVSIAAMITLSVSLVVTMQQEAGQPLISEIEIEMFGAATLIEEVVMPQIISADNVLKQELKTKKNNEKDLHDMISGEAALGAVGDYRAPVNPPARTKIKIMERRDKNENVDEARASAPAALGATADIYRAEEKAEAPKARMKEVSVKKILLKEKSQLQIEALEESIFFDEQITQSATSEIVSDDEASIKRDSRFDSQTQELMDINKLWEERAFVSAKQAFEEFMKKYPNISEKNIREILEPDVYQALIDG